MTDKDNDNFSSLVERLQGDEFHNMVAEKVARLRNVPLTDELRDEVISQLKNRYTIKVGPGNRAAMHRKPDA